MLQRRVLTGWTRGGGGGGRGTSWRGAQTLLPRAETTPAAPAPPSNKEDVVRERLQAKFGADAVKVKDVSGGCGDFFDIVVTSSLFQGKSIVEQHRMVNDLIRDIDRHGATISTKKAST